MRFGNWMNGANSVGRNSSQWLLNIQRALGLNVDEKNEMNREVIRREDPNAPRTPDRALSTTQKQTKRNGPASAATKRAVTYL